MSEKKKITIHRALAELKLIDSKITKRIGRFTPIGICRGVDATLVNNVLPKESFITSAKSDFQSITDLINRKATVKNAIMTSNATTEVTVGGVTMTVSEAIVRRDIIELKIELLNRMKVIYTAAVKSLEGNNVKIEDNALSLAKTALGKDVDAEKADAQTMMTAYKTANLFSLCDPLELVGKMDTLEDEIGTYDTDIDAVLSESNAITFIEV